MGILGKEDSVVGLDISADRVNICQLKKTGEKVSLVALGTERISEEPQPKEEMGAESELTISAIQRLLKNNNIKVQNAYTSVSGDLVIVRYIKLPLMPKEELREVIKFQAEEYIPFDINEVVLDFELLREVVEEGEKKSEVLLVAVKEDVIRRHIEI
ncbi:pilus assembly protein PilM, partial [bacterium]|nr:pilus assembly protein PilM [bacterium]